MINKIKLNIFWLNIEKDFKQGINILEEENWYWKAQPLWSNVLTPKGFINIWNIKIWDTIISWRTWKYVKVTWVFPQWIKDVYKITTNKWQICYASWEHLWEVYDMHEHRKSKDKNKDINNYIKVINTNDLLLSWLLNNYWNSKNVCRYKIPKVKDIELNSLEELHINPYVLWLLIAEWSLNNNWVRYTNSEDDINNKINLLISDNEQVIRKIYANWKQVNEIQNKLERNKWWYWYNNTQTQTSFYLDYYNLRCKSIHKFIPEQYKYTSIENRYLLLQWLFDWDAYVSWTRIEYTTSSKQLFNDVKFILDSLWYNYTTSNKIWKYKKDWIINECNISYIIWITWEINKLVSSEKHLWRINKFWLKENDLFIKSIEKYSEEECVCISVEDQLYITDDFIVTHNTTILNSIVSLFTNKYPWLRTLPDWVISIDSSKWNAILSKNSWIGSTNEPNDLYQYIVPGKFFELKSTTEQRKVLIDLLELDYNSFMKNECDKAKSQFTYLEWTEDLEKKLKDKLKEFETNETLILKDITRLKSEVINFEEKTFEDIIRYNEDRNLILQKIQEYNKSIIDKQKDYESLCRDRLNINNSINAYTSEATRLSLLNNDINKTISSLRDEWNNSNINSTCDKCWSQLTWDNKQKVLDWISKIAANYKNNIKDNEAKITELIKSKDELINKLNELNKLIDSYDTNFDLLSTSDLLTAAVKFDIDIVISSQERLNEYEEYNVAKNKNERTMSELKYKEDSLRSINTLKLSSSIDKLKDIKSLFTKKLEEATSSLPLDIELFEVLKNWNVKETFTIKKDWIDYYDLSQGNKMIVNIMLAKLFIDKLWLDFILIDESSSISKSNIEYIKELSKDYQIILAKATPWSNKDFK